MPGSTNTPHDRAALWTSVTFLALGLIFGGGTRQGLWGDSLLNLLALPLLVWATWRSHRIGSAPALWLGVVGFALIGIWNVVQLFPLPLAWWTALPGRAELAAELKVAGVVLGPRPISLDVEAGVRATLALIPPLAVGLMTATLPTAQRHRLLQMILLLAMASLILGLAQLAGGQDSPLRWHAITNPTEAVGPFANRNHLASLIALALPLAVAQIIVSSLPPTDRRAAQRRWLRLTVGTLGMMLLLLGLAIARSRAGVVLAAIALIPCALMLWRRQPDHEEYGRGLKRWLLVTLIAGLLASVQFGFWRLMERFERDPLEDSRWSMTETTLRVAEHFGPLGIGAGGFASAYESGVPSTERTDYFVNRAHNDWAEWFLEGGWPLAALLGLGLGLLMWGTLQAWRDQGEAALWRRAAAIGLWLILLHSVADYPLRTTALSVFSAALMAHLLKGSAPRH